MSLPTAIKFGIVQLFIIIIIELSQQQYSQLYRRQRN